MFVVSLELLRACSREEALISRKDEVVLKVSLDVDML